jgi:hypothetical protein
MLTKFCSESLKESDHLGKLGEDGRTILKLILKMRCRCECVDSIYLD